MSETLHYLGKSLVKQEVVLAYDTDKDEHIVLIDDVSFPLGVKAHQLGRLYQDFGVSSKRRP